MGNKKKTKEKSLCKICNITVTHEDKQTKCANCLSIFHIECVGVTRTQYVKILNTSTWFCSTSCKVNNERSSTKLNNSGIDLSDDDYDENESVIKSDTGDIKTVLKKLDTVLRSQEFLSNKFDKIEKQNSALLEECAIMKKQLAEKEQQIDKLSKKFKIIETDVNNLKQEKLVNHVVLIGVQTVIDTNTNKENVKQVVINTSSINCKLTENDIVYAYRLTTKVKKQHCPILVCFTNTLTKFKFIESIKNNATHTDTTIIDQNSTTSQHISRNNKIRAFDYLTKTNFQLLSATKKFAFDNHYKYVWFQNNNVCLRKAENSKIIRVTCFEDLPKINV